MKICVAQTRPVKGDIVANISNHNRLIDLAVTHNADAIFFPELSLTGYEPRLSKELATDKNDSRLDVFQTVSDENNITIIAGLPTKLDSYIFISSIIFQPHQLRQAYSKQHLHEDELPYFACGNERLIINVKNVQIAPAICYEISIAEHAENAYKSGAEIYVASVAKSSDGVDKAHKQLAAIAKKYAMTVLLSNCIGWADNFEGAGRSAIWNKEGILAGNLNDSKAGILLFDTETEEVISEYPDDAV